MINSLKWRQIIPVGVGLLALALTLAWISTGFSDIQGWLSFLAVIVLCTGLLLACWRALKDESLPRWLGMLLAGAALLRLAVGVLWFIGLPANGYDTPMQNAGYVMADAHTRDTVAWDLAQSDESLIATFGEDQTADQYGGSLFLFALLYRTLGGTVHQPLLMVVVSASFSALAILFTWAFCKRVWDEKVAKLAAWSLALYPEAVLLGSSQMREAFTGTLIMAAIYGLLKYWQNRKWTGAVWIIVTVGLTLLLSAPTATFLVVLLGAVTLALSDWRAILKTRFWFALGILILVTGFGMWLAWDSLVPDKFDSPFEVLVWWFRNSAGFQQHYVERASGWIQNIFRNTPEWAHTPFIIGYGIVQPLLPAAIIAPAPAIWKGIAIWRAAGWTVLLAMLLYAIFRAIKQKNWRGIPIGLNLVVWFGILTASYRGGGDQWDNPRYRVAFAGIQIAMGAWAWMEYRRDPDPWMRRGFIGAGLIASWMFIWYLGRYIEFFWPVTVRGLFQTIGLGFVSMVLYWLWDWAGEDKKESVD